MRTHEVDLMWSLTEVALKKRLFFETETLRKMLPLTHGLRPKYSLGWTGGQSVFGCS